MCFYTHLGQAVSTGIIYFLPGRNTHSAHLKHKYTEFKGKLIKAKLRHKLDIIKNDTVIPYSIKLYDSPLMHWHKYRNGVEDLISLCPGRGLGSDCLLWEP